MMAMASMMAMSASYSGPPYGDRPPAYGDRPPANSYAPQPPGSYAPPQQQQGPNRASYPTGQQQQPPLRVENDRPRFTPRQGGRNQGPPPGPRLRTVCREADVPEQMAQFYEILGFKRIPTYDFKSFQVIWMQYVPLYALHLIERDNKGNQEPPKDPRTIPDSQEKFTHCPVAERFDATVARLRETGVQVYERMEGNLKQAFFFDPEGYAIGMTNGPVVAPPRPTTPPKLPR